MSLIDRILNRVLPKLEMRRIFAFIVIFSFLFFCFTLLIYIKTNHIYFTDCGFFAVANYFILDYFDKWGSALNFITTILLAFAAFWVISDTRYFRYLDDKTKTISELYNWCADVIRNLSKPSLQADTIRDIQKNIIECRTGLMINVAQSIGLFSSASKLSSHPNVTKGKELKQAIENTDKELRDYVTYLFSINFTKMDSTQIDDFPNRASLITVIIRKLLEISSQL